MWFNVRLQSITHKSKPESSQPRSPMTTSTTSILFSCIFAEHYRTFDDYIAAKFNGSANTSHNYSHIVHAMYLSDDATLVPYDSKHILE